MKPSLLRLIPKERTHISQKRMGVCFQHGQKAFFLDEHMTDVAATLRTGVGNALSDVTRSDLQEQLFVLEPTQLVGSRSLDSSFVLRGFQYPPQPMVVPKKMGLCLLNPVEIPCRKSRKTAFCLGVDTRGESCQEERCGEMMVPPPQKKRREGELKICPTHVRGSGSGSPHFIFIHILYTPNVFSRSLSPLNIFLQGT